MVALAGLGMHLVRSACSPLPYVRPDVSYPVRVVRGSGKPSWTLRAVKVKIQSPFSLEREKKKGTPAERGRILGRGR